MGYYKNLLVKAESGDKETMAVIAEHYQVEDNANLAIYWYTRAGKRREAAELQAKVSVKDPYAEVEW